MTALAMVESREQQGGTWISFGDTRLDVTAVRWETPAGSHDLVEVAATGAERFIFSMRLDEAKALFAAGLAAIESIEVNR